jgi:hypothetical protein
VELIPVLLANARFIIGGLLVLAALVLAWSLFFQPPANMQTGPVNSINLTGNFSINNGSNPLSGNFLGGPMESTSTFPSDVYVSVPVANSSVNSSSPQIGTIQDLTGCSVSLSTPMNASVSELGIGQYFTGFAPIDNSTSPSMVYLVLQLQSVWVSNETNVSATPVATFQLTQGPNVLDIFSMNANESYVNTNNNINLTVSSINCLGINN